MNGEPIVATMIIRDGHSYGKDLKLTNVKLSEAVIAIDEYCHLKSNNQLKKIWTCRLGWHNFPDLKKDTKCKECQITVQEVMAERRRLISVKNIVLFIKMNVRRWGDEQFEHIKAIIDKEYDRRCKRDDGVIREQQI